MSDAPDDPGTKLRLVSWNVHGVATAERIEERLAAIARSLRARRPDLVLLQEVWRSRDAEQLGRRLARDGYVAVEGPSAGWLMRTAGLLSFVRASAGWRASAPRFHEFTVEAPDWKLWEGDGLGDKGVQGFTLSRDGLAFEVLNTHLQAAYAPGGYREVRRAQLAELRAVVEAAEGAAVLVAGDLNTAADEPEWSEVADLRDLTATLREGCGCGTAVGAEPPRWIDHLLMRLPEGWRVEARVALLRSQRPDVPYSDHQGLDAILELRPPQRASLAALAAARLVAPSTRRALLANAALWAVARRLGA